MLSSIFAVTALLLAAANARVMTAAELLGENTPWRLTNLTISALLANTTFTNHTSHITFTATDENPGLNFTSRCGQLAPAGQSLFQNGYTKCEFKDAAFSLREGGQLWFQRIYKIDQPPPFNYVICNGQWDYRQAEYYSNDVSGLVVFQPSLDIPCTSMTS